MNFVSSDNHTKLSARIRQRFSIKMGGASSHNWAVKSLLRIKTHYIYRPRKVQNHWTGLTWPSV